MYGRKLQVPSPPLYDIVRSFAKIHCLHGQDHQRVGSLKGDKQHTATPSLRTVRQRGTADTEFQYVNPSRGIQ